MHEILVLDVSLASKSTFSRFQKNHNKEYVSCFNNLEKIKRLLNQGKKLAELEHHPSFFRHETNGIFRIGQSCDRKTRISQKRKIRITQG